MDQKDKGQVQQQPSGQNEGEGNKTAALRYDRETAAHAASGKAAEAGRRAAEAVDGPEGPDLRDAEERAARQSTR